MERRITRTEYLENSSELFDKYYLQFATTATERQILNELGMEELRASQDYHLNDVKIPFNTMSSGRKWWWDTIIIRRDILSELGEIDSPATRTCVGKATARKLLAEDKNNS